MDEAFDIEDLSTWTTALRTDSTSAERKVTYQIAKRVVLMDFYATCELSLGDDGWKQLLDDGFLSLLLDLLCQDFICNFSLEDMIEDSDETDEHFEEAILPPIIDIISMLNETLIYVARLCDHSTHQPGTRRAVCDDCRRAKLAAEVIAEKYTSFIKRVWEARHPLITYSVDVQSSHVYPSDAHNCDGPECLTCLKFSIGQILPQCFEKICIVSYAFHEDKILTRRFAECVWHNAFVLFEIWMNSWELKTRGWSMMDLSRALDLSGPFIGGMPYMTLFREIVGDDEDLKADIYQNMINDLIECRWDWNHGLFHSLMKLFTQFRSEREVNMRSSLQRAILRHSLAVSRRQFCSTLHDAPEEGKTLFDDQCSSGMGVYLTKVLGLRLSESEDEKPPIPELWIHEIIPILGIALVTMAKNEQVYRNFDPQFDRTVDSIYEVARILRYYMRHPSDSASSSWVSSYPPSPSARRYSRKVWQETLDELLRRGISNHITLKYVLVAWRKLGHELDRGLAQIPVHVSNSPDSGPLERCADPKCLCSAYYAVHSMKVCKGCFKVAYCNEQCQKRDWMAHRETCLVAARKLA